MTNSKRYKTFIQDGTIFVEADMGSVEIGPLQDVLDFFGREYTIEYDSWEKNRYNVSFADEGLSMDVVDTIEAMTHDKTCVEWLQSKPLNIEEAYENPDKALFSTGRMALFTGFLKDSLDNGPR